MYVDDLKKWSPGTADDGQRLYRAGKDAFHLRHEHFAIAENFEGASDSHALAKDPSNTLLRGSHDLDTPFVVHAAPLKQSGSPDLYADAKMAWTFDEGSGSTAHDVAGGHDGQIVNGAFAAGQIGDGLAFNGASSYVSVPDSPDFYLDPADFSLDFWVRFDVAPTGLYGQPSDVFLSQDEGVGAQSKWFFAAYAGFLEFHTNSPEINAHFIAQTPFNPVPGEWYNLALTRTGPTYSVYINGEQAGSDVDFVTIPDVNAPLTIGKAEEDFGGFVHGVMDNVLIYGRLLTPDDVKALYLYRPNPGIFGTENNDDSLNGTENGDPIYGLGGNDSVSGGVGDDTIHGGLGADTVKGSAGDDRLDGGAGADRLFGGAGNDTYLVDTTGDRAYEATSGGSDDGGTDLVIASNSYTLIQFVENLTLAGNAVSAYGNSLDNVLRGDAINNVLDGMGGADTLYGGAGNDRYYVDNPGDVVSEQTVPGDDDGGTDKVISTVSFTLDAFVENLELVGAASINGTGNSLANTLTGNAADNRLAGMAGKDKVTGGDGADVFVFSHYGSANGVDHLMDFISGIDHLAFTASDFGWSPGHILSPAELSQTGTAVGVTPQFVYDPASHQLSWDSNGSRSGGRAALAIFDNGEIPSVGDFIFA